MYSKGGHSIRKRVNLLSMLVSLSKKRDDEPTLPCLPSWLRDPHILVPVIELGVSPMGPWRGDHDSDTSDTD